MWFDSSWSTKQTSIPGIPDDGQTPLHVAACYGTLEVARVLLEHGASVIEGDNEGMTASQVALDYGEHEIMKLLSEHGDRSL